MFVTVQFAGTFYNSLCCVWFKPDVRLQHLVHTWFLDIALSEKLLCMCVCVCVCACVCLSPGCEKPFNDMRNEA